FTGHRDKIRSVDFSPDGRRLVTASWDKTVRIWDTATGAELKRLADPESSFQFAAWNADGSGVIGILSGSYEEGLDYHNHAKEYATLSDVEFFRQTRGNKVAGNLVIDPLEMQQDRGQVSATRGGYY